MDHLSAHKVDGVQALIEACGAEARYLPPYSPDFNPIEKCWSKVKLALRAAKVRTLESLEQAMTEALAIVSAENVHGWFRYCGYELQKQ